MSILRMLMKWDFSDEVANSSVQQVNRQKSARNLKINDIDHGNPRATFYDFDRKETHTATLNTCDCNDFNFAGKNPRKTLKPCMHIYRLAMELGLIELKYLDHNARVALYGSVSREETQKLRELFPDRSQWGQWSAAVHHAHSQRERQFRAYEILRKEGGTIQPSSSGWKIHNYAVTLFECECPDFQDRKLPCKHIYTAALISSITLPLTENDYDSLSKGIGYF